MGVKQMLSLTNRVSGEEFFLQINQVKPVDPSKSSSIKLR
jgi:hypothetical protein